jgi:SMI1 / KNR4 family (SUKH-1)
MEKLEQLLLKYKFEKRTISLKTTFEEVEDFINFKLPDDYKFFAKNYLDFEESIGEEYVRLLDFDELIEVNTDYEILEYLTTTLIIGGNAGGEYIAIEQTEQNNLRIILSPYIVFEKEAHIEIGSSFTDFLERLDKGQEWFK